MGSGEGNNWVPTYVIQLNFRKISDVNKYGKADRYWSRQDE